MSEREIERASSNYVFIVSESTVSLRLMVVKQSRRTVRHSSKTDRQWEEVV